MYRFPRCHISNMRRPTPDARLAHGPKATGTRNGGTDREMGMSFIDKDKLAGMRRSKVSITEGHSLLGVANNDA